MALLGRWRQEALAQEIAKGTDPRKAYLAAGYKTQGLWKTVVNQKEIVERVKEIKAEQEDKAMQSVKGKSGLLKVLSQIADTGTDANRIKAINLIAQMTGIIKDSSDIDDNKTASELTDAELVAMIDSITEKDNKARELETTVKRRENKARVRRARELKNKGVISIWL